MRASTVLAIGLRGIETGLRKRLRLPARPYKWLLELTLECNSRCTSCAIWKTPAKVKRQQLTLLEIEAQLAKDGRDLAWLALSGGEVTRYEQFCDVIGVAKRHCTNLRLVTFTTNGLLPEKALQYAQAVRAAGFDSFITISLDGDEEVHDRIRGVPGNHRLAWQTYHLLQSHGIRVQFGITVSAANAEFIERHYGELHAAIRAVSIQHEQGIYAQDNRIDDVAIARALGVIDRSYRAKGFGEWIEKCYIALGREFVRRGRSANPIPCAAGHASLHIRSDGNVLACMFLPPLGNVRQGNSPRALVNSEIGLALRAQVGVGRCPHCWMNCYAPHSILSSPVASLMQWIRVRHSPVSDGAAVTRRFGLQERPVDSRRPRRVPVAGMSHRVLPVLESKHDGLH